MASSLLAEEAGYIAQGTVQMVIRGQATLTLRPGDGFLIPPSTPLRQDGRWR